MSDAQTLPATVGKCPACKVEGIKLKDVNGLLICDKCASKRFSSRVRKTIQEAFERQEAQRQIDAWKKRIDLAKKGIAAYEAGQYQDAAKHFREYLAILENRYGVPRGGLNPALFNQKEDAGEILLISGIYWDLAKIYDRMKGQNTELKISLNKFIEFSIGRPHIILTAEAIRKYIQSEGAHNVNDFKNAHQTVVQHLAKCFIATAVFGPSAHETHILRRFRDDFLKQNQLGRKCVYIYYKFSPPIARVLVEKPQLNVFIRGSLKIFTRAIEKWMR